MDRRRFVPSSEGLEGRALLSTSPGGLSGLFGQTSSVNANPADNPATFRVKVQRIERLPHYLDTLQANRLLPNSVVQPLQVDLLSIAGELHKADPKLLTAFNLELRGAINRVDLSPSDARGLNARFGQVLASTGASPQQVTNLQNDLNNLARIDAQTPNSDFLATNDYAIVLQSALAVGHHIETPTGPLLSVRDGTQLNGGGVTANPQPSLVGTYLAGATTDAGTKMLILDDAGHVYGSGAVLSSGRWRAQISPPIAPGKYVFHIRAIDPQGHVSNPSTRFVLKVVAPRPQVAAETLTPPHGPLGAAPKVG